MKVIHSQHYERIILDLVWDAIKVDVAELKKSKKIIKFSIKNIKSIIIQLLLKL